MRGLFEALDGLAEDTLLICHPSRAAVLGAIVELLGYDLVAEVSATPLCAEGRVMIIAKDDLPLIREAGPITFDRLPSAPEDHAMFEASQALELAEPRLNGRRVHTATPTEGLL